MRRLSFSRLRAGGLPLALAAGLALTASACMAPSAKQSSAAGPAGQQAAKAGGKSESWWQRMTRSGQEPEERPWVYGDVRPGKGLLGNDEDGFVLLRKGEGQSPARSGKPEKVRR